MIINAFDTECIFGRGQQGLVYLRQIFVRWSNVAAHTHGLMPTSSAFKAVARPSGDDARGVAGAVHADALQQWRQCFDLAIA